MPVSEQASCACGKVVFETVGPPIMRAVCYCDDCQRAGHLIAARPDAPSVLGPDGGTDFVLFRKDRVVPVRGEELLDPVRLHDQSPTKRVIATCCNSAMHLDFEKGHWLSLYRDRLRSDPGPVQMRIQTRFMPEGATPPPGAPVYRSFPLKFIANLLKARVAMLFGR